jgi:hypothetical protein
MAQDALQRRDVRPHRPEPVGRPGGGLLIPKATAITCDRYGQDRIVSETHFKRGDDIIAHHAP